MLGIARTWRGSAQERSVTDNPDRGRHAWLATSLTPAAQPRSQELLRQALVEFVAQQVTELGLLRAQVAAGSGRWSNLKRFAYHIEPCGPQSFDFSGVVGKKLDRTDTQA